MICSGVVKVSSCLTTSIAACLCLGVEGVFLMVAVVDIDAENSRIAIAMSWTMVGPHWDNCNHFDGGRGGDGDEDAARLRWELWDETMPVMVACI